MNLKYWEWEAQPMKEKMKAPSVRFLTDVLYENETHAYRFACALEFVKQKKYARLKDFPKDLPMSTWLRYLDHAVQLGILDKSSTGVYELTNRFSNPLRNLADYYKKWRETQAPEDLAVTYPRAKKGTYPETASAEQDKTQIV